MRCVRSRGDRLTDLWEYAKRFASHVDWQLSKSRILPADGDPFMAREESLWLRHSRLSGADDAEFDACGGLGGSRGRLPGGHRRRAAP